MNKLHFLKTKYGDTVVSNQSKEQIVYNEDGSVFDRFPAGLVIRWIPEGKNEPDLKIVEGVFTTSFKSDNDIIDYINNNNILG